MHTQHDGHNHGHGIGRDQADRRRLVIALFVGGYMIAEVIVIVDDNRIAKRGRKMDGISKICGPAVVMNLIMGTGTAS